MNREQISINNEQRTMNNEQRSKNKDKKTKDRILFSLFTVLCSLFSVLCSLPESDKSRNEYDPDLFGWRPASMTPFSVNESISGFAYGKVSGKDRYTAISTGGAIAWSDDGDIWLRAVRRVECDRVLLGDRCGEVFLIGLQDISYVCTKYEEENNPNLRTVTPPGVFNAVTFGDGIFVAAGNKGFFAHSENGKEWIVAQKDGFASDGTIRGLAWGNGVFTAVGSNSNRAYVRYSIDGETWSAGPVFTQDHSRLNDVAYDYATDSFYYIGNYTIWGYVSYSPNSGMNLQNLDPNVITTEARKLAVSNTGVPTLGIIFDWNIGSSNNEQWYRRPFVIQRSETSAGWTNCGDPDCLSKYCFGRLFWKPDLFKNPRDSNNANININDITYGNGYFVAAADAGVIGHLSGHLSGDIEYLFSGGDRFWNALAIPEFIETNFTAIESLNGRFFIGNNNGKIGYSK